MLFFMKKVSLQLQVITILEAQTLFFQLILHKIRLQWISIMKPMLKLWWASAVLAVPPQQVAIFGAGLQQQLQITHLIWQ